MNTILLPTDFTESMTSALNWARLFTHHYNATLILLHVREVGELRIPADTDSLHHDQLSALASQFQSEGITCQTDLRQGAVKDTILAAAQDHGASLIITGHKHITNFFGRFGSSAATDVAQGAHCPVLVVPANAPEQALQPLQVQTIVFTTSLEFDQDDEFRQVVDMTRSFGATLRILHVRAENQPNLNDDMEMLGQLQAVYGTDLLLSDTVDSRTVSGGIETYLETNPADLLVMTTRERDFLSGLLNPSLTGRLVRLSNLPILIYHAQATL